MYFLCQNLQQKSVSQTSVWCNAHVNMVLHESSANSNLYTLAFGF